MDSRTSMHNQMPVLRTCCMWPNCHHFLSVYKYLVDLCKFFSAMWTVKPQRGTRKMNRKMPVQAQVR